VTFARLEVLFPIACVMVGIVVVIFAGRIGYRAVSHWKQYNKLKRSLRPSNVSLKEEEFKNAWTNTVYTIVLVIVFASVIIVAVMSFASVSYRADFSSEVVPKNIIQVNRSIL